MGIAGLVHVFWWHNHGGSQVEVFKAREGGGMTAELWTIFWDPEAITDAVAEAIWFFSVRFGRRRFREAIGGW